MDWRKIIDKHYSGEGELKETLWLHSEAVARKALECARRHPELELDLRFLEEAAMVHDIGIHLTHAPAIGCLGHLPYLAHGLAGALIMETEGFPAHARVCARHTGSGLTRADIEAQNLPLPKEDLLPETLEEKLICYADKFFSKSWPEGASKSEALKKEKSLERVRRSMTVHGPDALARFEALHALFG